MQDPSVKISVSRKENVMMLCLIRCKNIKKMIVHAIFIAAVVVCNIAGNPLTSHATVWCTGNITRVYVASDGSIIINPSYNGSWAQICNVGQSWKGIDPMTCAYWFSIAKTAVSQNSQVILMYGDIDSCSTIPTYGEAPAPTYLMLVQ
jgi:hypothetical protein